MKEEIKYSFSYDGEFYHGEYDSVDDAIKDIETNELLTECKIVYIALDKKVTNEQLIDAEDLLDGMVDRASDIAGEVADDWVSDLYADKSLLDKLQQAILKVMAEENIKPSFWAVVNPQKYIFENGKLKKVESN